MSALPPFRIAPDPVLAQQKIDALQSTNGTKDEDLSAAMQEGTDDLVKTVQLLHDNTCRVLDNYKILHRRLSRRSKDSWINLDDQISRQIHTAAWRVINEMNLMWNSLDYHIVADQIDPEDVYSIVPKLRMALLELFKVAIITQVDGCRERVRLQKTEECW